MTPEQNFPDNTLYEMDNLDVLRGMNSQTVDLIATDPPFNTMRIHVGSAGSYVDNWRWGNDGTAPDQWLWNEVDPKLLDHIRHESKPLDSVIQTAGHCYGEEMAAYLCFLAIRLLEMHRILRPTGNIFLHCNYAANSYIRIMMDAIFGPHNFRNEIVWCYTGPSKATKWYPRKHDTILFYGKSNSAYFDPSGEKVPYKPGFNVGGENSWAKGQKDKGEYIRAGKTVEDWWDTFYPLIRNEKERTGSPDQKPITLYERIVRCASRPGDLVLDPFAGCATTIVAANNLGRRWIGIERRPDARHHVVCRMLGMRSDEVEKLLDNPMYGNWVQQQLDKIDSHYLTTAPVRTDAQ